MNTEPLYNLWHDNNLILEEATFDEVLDEMSVRGLHKDVVDLEELDQDRQRYNCEPELNPDR